MDKYIENTDLFYLFNRRFITTLIQNSTIWMTTIYNIIIYRASPCKNVESADIAIGLLIYKRDLKFPDIRDVPIYLRILAVAF